MTSYYEILGIDSTADGKMIKKAFRKIALAEHPDIKPGAEAMEKFKKVIAAYETLSNPAKRSSYDAVLLGEQKHAQELAERKRQQELAEKKRLAELAEKRRQEELAEKKRLAELAIKIRHEKLAEEKLLEEITKQKKIIEIAYNKRQALYAEQKRREALPAKYRLETPAEEKIRIAHEALTERKRLDALAQQNRHAAPATQKAQHTPPVFDEKTDKNDLYILLFDNESNWDQPRDEKKWELALQSLTESVNEKMQSYYYLHSVRRISFYKTLSELQSELNERNAEMNKNHGDNPTAVILKIKHPALAIPDRNKKRIIWNHRFDHKELEWIAVNKNNQLSYHNNTKFKAPNLTCVDEIKLTEQKTFSLFAKTIEQTLLQYSAELRNKVYQELDKLYPNKTNLLLDLTDTSNDSKYENDQANDLLKAIRTFRVISKLILIFLNKNMFALSQIIELQNELQAKLGENQLTVREFINNSTQTFYPTLGQACMKKIDHELHQFVLFLQSKNINLDEKSELSMHTLHNKK